MCVDGGGGGVTIVVEPLLTVIIESLHYTIHKLQTIVTVGRIQSACDERTLFSLRWQSALLVYPTVLLGHRLTHIL